MRRCTRRADARRANKYMINRDEKQLDPQKVVCVVKRNGKEVGRIPASSASASSYIEMLGEGVTVDHVEDAAYVRAYFMIHPDKWRGEI